MGYPLKMEQNSGEVRKLSNRPEIGAERAPLLKQSTQFFRRRFPALGADSDVVRMAVVVPLAVHIDTTRHTHDGHFFPRYDIPNCLEERKYH